MTARRKELLLLISRLEDFAARVKNGLMPTQRARMGRHSTEQRRAPAEETQVRRTVASKPQFRLQSGGWLLRSSPPSPGVRRSSAMASWDASKVRRFEKLYRPISRSAGAPSCRPNSSRPISPFGP
jgi:hypothetical protein